MIQIILLSYICIQDKRNTIEMEHLKKDLVVIGLTIDDLEHLTVKKASHAYKMRALRIHPDKVSKEEEDMKTEEFKELGKSYERILKYLVEKLKTMRRDTETAETDEETFVRDNFDKCNFPFENQGSFTVNVEDKLAETWQECFENVYGVPKITKNPNGTETDRFWKMKYGQEMEKIEITVHFYNHNKPKDKKRSKILVQGSNKSILCEYVFKELPKIYKLVCEKKPLMTTPLPQLKRKRLASSVKRRSIRYKPSSKSDGRLTCSYCNLTFDSDYKLARHKKSSHGTDVVLVNSPRKTQISNQQMLEDMSVLEISDDEDNVIQKIPFDLSENAVNKSEVLKIQMEKQHEQMKSDEILLVENSKCEASGLEANDEMDLKKHMEMNHSMRNKTGKKETSVSTVSEDTPSEEEFSQTNTIKCTESEYQGKGRKDQVEHQRQHVFASPAEEHCKFSTSTPQPLYKCKKCAFAATTSDQLQNHMKEEHTDIIKHISTEASFLHTCITCCYKTNDYNDLNSHIDVEHRQNDQQNQISYPEFKCDGCDSKYTTNSELTEHIEKEHKDHHREKCNFCPFEENDLPRMLKHIENQHCSNQTYSILRTLRELVTVVGTLSNDILQIRSDSIIINDDVMKMIKSSIVDEINENVKNKFTIVEAKIDTLTQQTQKAEKDNPDTQTVTNEELIEEIVADMATTTETKADEKEKSESKAHNAADTVLWVGDSHSNNLDRKAFEDMTATNVDMAIAYTVEYDKDAKDPERNFTKVLPERLTKKNYDTLVLQGGCDEISNLKIGKEFTAQDVSIWEDKVSKSRTKLYNLAEKCLAETPNLKTVIILSSLPRYDSEDDDPNSIKAKLNNFGNAVYNRLWMQKGCPQNIKIQDQKLECQGPLRIKRFGNPGMVGHNGKPWDGIHLRGALAVRHYTSSAARIFATQFRGRTVKKSVSQSEGRDYHQMCPQPNNQSEDRKYHQTCPQAIYQRRDLANYPNYGYNRIPYQYSGSVPESEQGYTQSVSYTQGRGFKRNNFYNNKYKYESRWNSPAKQFESEAMYTIPVSNRFNLNY